MRRLLLAAVVFVMASLTAAVPAFAQYGPHRRASLGHRRPGRGGPAGAAGGVGAAGTGTSGTGTGNSGLAFTGSDLIELLLRVGIVLVAVGGIVLLLSRRRRFRTIGS